MKNKIDKLVAENHRLSREIDEVSEDLKLLHIEYAYICELRDMKKKSLN